MNWYNYVGSDPINFTDPTGLCNVNVFAKFTHYKNPDGTLELKSFDGFSFEPDGCNFADPDFGFPTSGQEALEGLFDAAVDKLKDVLPSEKEVDKFLRCAAETGRSHGLDLAIDAAGLGAIALTAKFRVAGSVAAGLIGVADIRIGAIQKDGTRVVTGIIGKQAANTGFFIPNSAVAKNLGFISGATTVASAVRNITAASNTFNNCATGQ